MNMANSFKVILQIICLANIGTCFNVVNITSSNCINRNPCDGSYKGCSCDELCAEYGDCCLQARSYDRSKMVAALNKYSCLSGLPGGSYYMKGNCRKDWPNDSLKKLCLNSSSKNSSSESFHNDPFLETPVTSAASNVTYKNYYCAVCHNEPLRDLQAWKARLFCLDADEETISRANFSDNIKFLNGSWTLLINNVSKQVFNSCDVVPVVPEEVKDKVRKCETYIGTCSAKWTDKRSASLCHSYTNLIYNKAHAGLPYRNLHCAMCNYVGTNNLDCYKSNIFKTTEPESPPASLSVLFDFRASEDFCTAGHMWDPFSKQCRTVSCQKKNYEFHHGRCYEMSKNSVVLYKGNAGKVDIDNTELNTDESDEASCDKVFINNTDYLTLPNLTVIINNTNQIYDPNEYEVQDDGIFVCIQPSNYSALMGRLTIIGLSLSSVCLVLHLIVFTIVPELRNLSGKNFASLCLTLLAAYICFIISTFMDSSTSNCQLLGLAMYYFFLASFIWMNVISFDVWRTFHMTTSMFQISHGSQWKKFLRYSLYSWSLPGIASALVFIIDCIKPAFIPESFLPKMGQKSCWFGQRFAILVYFAAPVALVVAMNIVYFVMAVRIVAATSASLNSLSASKSQKIQLRLFLRLAILMGLSWISGIIAGIFENEYVWYLFIILNAFQGIYILIAYTCTKKVRRLLINSKTKLLKSSSRNSSSNKLSNSPKAYLGNQLQTQI